MSECPEEFPQQLANSNTLEAETREVGSVQELVAATQAPDVREIHVLRSLAQVPELRLQCGQRLCGSSNLRPLLTFVQGSDGIELTADNHVSELRLVVEPRRCAIKNAQDSEKFGRILLDNVTATGRVSIVLTAQRGRAHLDIHGLHIEGADTTEEMDRPLGYGVSVLQGAFSLWNKRSSDAGVMTADLLDISVGRPDAPVLGSGIFVCGADHADFSLRIQRLRTGAVNSDGQLAAGTADCISGGVFVVHGATVDTVENYEPVTTFGLNDMALDSWGRVDRWIAHEKVTTYGESAIGFVNFGELRLLSARAPIETHGTGARGFNVYGGTVDRAEFDRIETYGDGAVAVQISRPVGVISVRRGIETHGAKGRSLVKGVIEELVATGLSIRPGGSAQEIRIHGGLHTSGTDVPALEQAGLVQRLVIEDGFGSANFVR